MARSSVCCRLLLAIAVALSFSICDLDLESAAFNLAPAARGKAVRPFMKATTSRRALEGFDFFEPLLDPQVPDVSTPSADQSPQWATCFVQAQQASQSVLEDWVLRGERSSLSAFRAWRHDALEATNVHCVAMTEEEALNTVCIECASSDAPAPHGVEAPDTAGGVAFGNMSQCMAQTAAGFGFCKSAQVALVY